MSKQNRHRLILETISGTAVASQSELRDLLTDRGVVVNQATLSRDIKELGLVKWSEDGVGYRYVRPEDASPQRRTEYEKVIQQFVRKVESSRNLLVLSTELGNGPPVAVAIDRLRMSEVLGSVAGDDTVLVVLRDDVDAKRVRDHLRHILRGRA